MALLVTVELRSRSGIDADSVVNSFSFAGGLAPPNIGEVTAVMEAVDDFYNVATAPQTMAIGTRIAACVSRAVNDMILRAYDITGFLDGSPHGSPIQEFGSTLTARSGGAIPDQVAEVAFAVTLHATGRSTAPVETPDGIDPGTARDRPKARRTGKIYLGPLTTEPLVNDANLCPRPGGLFPLNARQAVDNLHAAALGASPLSGYTLGVWSRSDETVRGLEAVSTDDAFDSQRRRGVSPTARLILAIT